MTTKTLCTGAHTPPATKTTVDREATLAALQGVPLYTACPYAEGTEAALHFVAVWLMVRQADVPLHPRPPTEPQQPTAAQRAAFETFFNIHPAQ